MHSKNTYDNILFMNLNNIKYQGKVATKDDIDFINRVIKENPNVSRRALSKKVCEEWNWVQPNGHLCDMVCRGFMLKLHRAGLITLPPKKCTPNNPLLKRKKPPIVEIDKTPLTDTLGNITPLEIRQVRRTEFETLFNSLIDQYHYLGYCHPVGENLKYIVFTNERPIAFISWSSAPRIIDIRDKYIGWSKEVRIKNVYLIAYNNRFLIPQWIKIPNLASNILGKMAKKISTDWQDIYSHPIYFLETFVDTEHFSGTCYKAANWRFIGNTKGRGKKNRTQKQMLSIKALWGYPLKKNFRKLLQSDIIN